MKLSSFGRFMTQNKNNRLEIFGDIHKVTNCMSIDASVSEVHCVLINGKGQRGGETRDGLHQLYNIIQAVVN